MILNEISVERLHFTCTKCGKSWTAEYDVPHVEDGSGHDRDYYSYDGLPCPDPTATGETLCPGCGHGRVLIAVAARRASPAVSTTRRGDRGTRPGAQKAAERAVAPLLAGSAEAAP